MSYEKAVRLILDALSSDLQRDNALLNKVHLRLFDLQYPALSGAIDRARQLVTQDKEIT
jgi:hypothetical protein